MIEPVQQIKNTLLNAVKSGIDLKQHFIVFIVIIHTGSLSQSIISNIRRYTTQKSILNDYVYRPFSIDIFLSGVRCLYPDKPTTWIN